MNKPLSLGSSWNGNLLIAHDMAVYFGPIGDNRAHSHFAHQIIKAVEGTVHAKFDELTQEADCIGIASGQVHQLARSSHPSFVVFAEPLIYDFQCLMSQLRACGKTLTDIKQAVQTCATPAQIDTRLLYAIEQIDVLLDSNLNGHDLAKLAHLSLSQAERLLNAQVGLSARRLILWRRLRAVIKALSGGLNLTQASHLAGFADSAHLSRTIRSMFGVRADRSLLRMSLINAQAS